MTKHLTAGSRENLDVWGCSVPASELDDADIAYLASLPAERPNVEWLWSEMNRVWKDLGLDNTRPLENQPIGAYYRHPVWIANGAFTSADPVSVAHRVAIANYLCDRGLSTIVDFGGGGGGLAQKIVETNYEATVAVVEPYPSALLRRVAAVSPRISVASDLRKTSPAQCIILQDVLEHVADPVSLVLEISGSVEDDGVLIFANCFYPVISCHLPSTFHLRHTFRWVAAHAGLRYLGRVPGAEHALVFSRKGRISRARARTAEGCSVIAGSVINALAAIRKIFIRPSESK